MALVRGRGLAARPLIKWSPPKEGMFKMNGDGPVFEQPGQSGFGAVIRDHPGSILAAFLHQFSALFSPAMVEVMAVLLALQRAQNICFDFSLSKRKMST